MSTSPETDMSNLLHDLEVMNLQDEWEREKEKQKNCDHYFVPVGEYDQLGLFICIHCKLQK
jgi:hypothetical protein